MTQGNLIQLKIDRSLSYTIDKQLDTELGQDIQLNKNQWQSVFNIVKSDKATEKQQYRGKGENINDGKDFRVDQNQVYSFTRNAWNAILEFARSSIKKEEKTETETKEMTLPTENKSSEDIVKEMLSEVDLKGVDLKDVVGKYNTILAVDKANNTTTPTEKIQKRLTNYVKGLKYHNFEAEAQANKNAEFHSDCAKAKSLDELSKAYQQFGKEYVEFLDQDGDGEINVHEMFYQELQDLYSSKGMNKTEAKKKAIEMLEKFKGYNIETLPDENSELCDTDEMELFTTVMKKIGLLDADKNRQISSDEAGAYLMTTAMSLDGKNNIKAAEATQTERGIAADGFNEEDLKEFSFTQEEAKNILSFNNYFKNNFNTYLEFVKSGKMPE